ncbi:hypothetical protein BGZ90_012170 [Linnemannia elongata]|nr:hypothetical protein BGZ90_012170 [Linnemannia elongata]
MAVTLPAIPKIVEPLDSSFAPLDQDQPDTSSGTMVIYLFLIRPFISFRIHSIFPKRSYVALWTVISYIILLPLWILASSSLADAFPWLKSLG